MNRYDCESVRDLLPLMIREQLLPHEASAVEAHAVDCADCRDEAALVRLLAAAAPAAPAGLEKRILLATRLPATRRRLPAPRLAMAATLAAAVIGGALVLERTGYDITPDAVPGTLVFDDMGSMSWTVSDDPLLHGGSALQQLSLEELEMVLAELDS